MDCDAVCNFTTVYALLSEKPQRKVLTLLVVDPRSLGIELAHHSISGSAPRKPSAEDLDRFGLDPKADPPPHYASYPAVDIELPLVAGPNELVIKQKLPMSTRGRGTDQVVRVMLLNLWSLRSWNKDDDFALYLNYAFGPAAVTQADGLRDNHVEPLCTISGYDYDNMEVPLVGYRDDRTGRVQYPILYRFVLPAMVDCRVGGRSGLRLEAPTNQLRGR